jgi:DNA-binding NarL/FixJ family response regulator
MAILRILLADDHAIVRQGVKALIGTQPDMEVIGEADEGASALKMAAELLPDVLIIDLSMPKLNGTQATEQIKQVCPGVKILVLTVHEDRGYFRRLLDAGASGYALKQAPADQLFKAIRIVAEGGIYLDPTLAGKVVGGLLREDSIRKALQVDNLSERETEVVRLIAKGYSNKEIAAQLAINAKTVETYKTRSLEKLGLRSRADLVRYALQRGWLQEG